MPEDFLENAKDRGIKRGNVFQMRHASKITRTQILQTEVILVSCLLKYEVHYPKMQRLEFLQVQNQNLNEESLMVIETTTLYSAVADYSHCLTYLLSWTMHLISQAQCVPYLELRWIPLKSHKGNICHLHNLICIQMRVWETSER